VQSERAGIRPIAPDRAAYVVGVALAGLVVLGGLLLILDANRDNFIVSFFTAVGDFLATPFDDLFEVDSRDGGVALNWGIGAFVYFILGVVAAGLIGRLTRSESG
jgi:hypothetical protein